MLKNKLYLHPAKGKWELSSAGSEHLPYKQGVIGSNPIAPTTKNPVNTLVLTGFHVLNSRTHGMYDKSAQVVFP